MMQATTVATPAPPSPPAIAPVQGAGQSAPAATASPGSGVVVFTGVDGKTQTLPIPKTKGEIEDLKARREELSTQLISAAGRRSDLASQLSTEPSGAARTGLEQRIMVLDQRIVELESDMAATGKQLSAAPLGVAEVPMPGDVPENVAIISTVFTVFVLFPLAVAFARKLWKRTSRESRAPTPLSPHVEQRLERLEQGVDAIAIEIERITEGQRFVTKLLSDTSQPALKLPQERAGISRE